MLIYIYVAYIICNLIVVYGLLFFSFFGTFSLNPVELKSIQQYWKRNKQIINKLSNFETIKTIVYNSIGFYYKCQ